MSVWNFSDGKLVTTIKAPPSPIVVTMEAIEWTPDGKYLAGGDADKGVGAPKDGIGHFRFYRMVDLGSPDLKPVVEEEVFRQEYFHFTPEGRLMVSGHEDGTVRLWRVVTKSVRCVVVE